MPSRTAALALLGLGLIAALATNCGSGDGDGTTAAAAPRGSPALAGWVTADGPVDDATVELQDADGNRLGKPVRTNRNGLWTEILDQAPDYLRIVAKGGRDKAGPIDGELISIVDPYTADESLHTGPATTLLAAWLDAHPDDSFDQGRERVAKFLELPPDWDVNGDTRVPFSGFSGPELMRDARGSGGLNSLVNDLVMEIENGDTHPYPAAPANQAEANPATAAGTAVLKAALNAALGTMAHQAVEGGQQQDLDQIKQNLDFVTGQVQTILNELNGIASELDLSDYDTKVSGLQTTIDYADNAYDKLTKISDAYEGNYSNPTPAEINDAKVTAQAFEDYYYYQDADRRQAFSDGPDLINQAMAGTGGDANASALYLWTKSHSEFTRFWNADTQARAGHAVNYWAGVQAQLLASNYAYAAINPSPNFPVGDWKQEYPAPGPSGAWQGRFENWLQHAGIDKMQPIVPSDISHGTVLDLATNTIWWALSLNQEATSYDLQEALGYAPSTRWGAPTKDQLSALLGPHGSYVGWQQATDAEGHPYSSPVAWLADNGFQGFITDESTSCRSDAVECTPDQRAYTTTGDDLRPQYQGDDPNCFDLDGAQRHTSNCRNNAYDLTTGDVGAVCTSECPKAYRLRSAGDNPGNAFWMNGTNFLFQQAYQPQYQFVPDLQEAATAPQ